MTKFADGAKSEEMKTKVDLGVREGLLILTTIVVNSEMNFNTDKCEELHVRKQPPFYIHSGMN